VCDVSIELFARTGGKGSAGKRGKPP
jgi:hypothetical protein